MNEIATVEQANLSVLESLVIEIKHYAENAGMNMLMLGRALSQAKQFVPHGEWEAWVPANTGVDIRWAQFCMACHARFGESEDYARLGTSKMQIMLALPPSIQDDFMEQNDVESMTTRKLREAVKQAREEARAEERAKAQAEIDRANEARRRAEVRADDLANRPVEIPDEIADDLRHKDAEIKRLSQQAQEAIDSANMARQEKAKIQRRFDETDALLSQTQSLYDQSQQQLNALRSEKKQEDEDGSPRNELSLDAFASAVSRFTATCARLPYMRNAFAVMDDAKRSDYDTLLKTMEGWCAGARKALDTIITGGIEIE